MGALAGASSAGGGGVVSFVNDENFVAVPSRCIAGVLSQFAHRVDTDATLFSMTDEPVMRAFHWLKERKG